MEPEASTAEGPKTKEEGASRRSSGAFRWIRILVTALLILWILRTIEWGEFGRTVLATDFFFLSLSILVTPALVVVNAWKWQILLRALEVRVRFGTCFTLYLVGKFFNNFLPTHVGGDVVRGVILGRERGKTPAALASVVVERVTGLVALLVVALIVLAWDRGRVFPTFVIWGALAAVGALGVAVALILSPRILAWVRERAHLPFVGKLGRFQAAVQEYKDHRSALWACFALSFVFYFLAAVNVYVSARAFGAPLGLVEASVATPIILVIMLFPISMGGIGLTEWAYIYVLGQYGVTSEAGLSTALLMRVKTILIGLLGGLVYMAQTRSSPRELSKMAGGATSSRADGRAATTSPGD